MSEETDTGVVQRIVRERKKLNVFLNDEEPEEINPLGKSDDKGLVINPNIGKRDIGNNDIVKEVTAIDALTIGATRASQINNVPQSSASKYSSGSDISNPDVRARILDRKYGIQDVAITKLMETLNVLDPSAPMKTRDRISMTGMLASVVEKLGNGKDSNDKPQVHLHLYGPNQKTEKDYEVIDV